MFTNVEKNTQNITQQDFLGIGKQLKSYSLYHTNRIYVQLGLDMDKHNYICNLHLLLTISAQQ